MPPDGVGARCLAVAARSAGHGEALVGVLGAALGAQVFIARVATFDWEFMLQKLATLAFWLVAFVFIHARTRDRSAPAAVCSRRWYSRYSPASRCCCRACKRWRRPAVESGVRLDGYAAVVPHSGLPVTCSVSARPVTRRDSIPISGECRDSGEGHRASEHRFRRLLDSSRRASAAPVSVYRRQPAARMCPRTTAVTFTPAIARFADDSFVFRRAFSRYAGTGLAVPSIWAGAMLVHKQYVTPFAATNALEAGVGEGYAAADHRGSHHRRTVLSDA